MMISILTLFPEMFQGPFGCSILKRAQEKGILQINLINIRDFATDKHKSVDDRPYGGGQGMIMKVDVVLKAIEHARKLLPQQNKFVARQANSQEKLISQYPNIPISNKVVLLSPTGKTFCQEIAREYAKIEHLILVCGHYEGFDARIEKFVDEVVSVGDYVLTGGEIPAMAITDAISRLIPGVLEKPESTREESFSEPGVLEYPQYTRPNVFRGLSVPEILLSGNHGEIEKWKKVSSKKR